LTSVIRVTQDDPQADGRGGARRRETPQRHEENIP
jgi:hypothetical protein